MSDRVGAAEPSSSSQTSEVWTLVDTGKYFCPFLDRGFCRKSSQCNFSHDPQESIRIPNDYCHFYLANQCLYGQECKFQHCEPSAEEPLADHVEGDASVARVMRIGYGAIDSDDESDAPEIGVETEQEDYNQDGMDGVEVYGRINAGGDDHLRSEAHNINTNNGSDGDGSPGYEIVRRFISTRIAGQPLGDRRLRAEADHSQEQASTDRHQQQQQPKKESNQGPSSRFRATISHRCTPINNAAYAASTPKLSNESAQSSSSDPSGPTIITTTTPSTSNTSTRSSSSSTPSKPAAKTWQGARLIASIRNNNLASDHANQIKATKGGDDSSKSGGSAEDGAKDLPLCPYALASGECPFPYGQCSYLHGEVCDLCYSPCLHPFNESQRVHHREECLREHEREMELSFAVQRSKDKVCGICMDTVVEKKPITSSRFGILEKCNHIFCLACIRKWRGTKQFDNRTIRACPECRVSSDFVVPSKYWVEDQDDKDKLIEDYKSALRAKPCRYFDEGKGECPFAGSCFYRHAYPDGRLAVLEAPRPRRRLYGARGLASGVTSYIFWNFITATDDELSDMDELESPYDWAEEDVDDIDDDDDLGWDV